MKTKMNVELLKVTTSEFRVSHPHVFKPSQTIVNGKPSGDPSYSIEMLFDKTTTKLTDMNRALNNAAIQLWGEDKSVWPKPMKSPIRDGDKPHGKKKEVKEEHKGQWVVRASSKAEYAAPEVIDQSQNQILKESDFYPGCYARAALKAVAYSYGDGSEGVKFVLDALQKTKDGKAFSGKKPANQIFGVVEQDDNEDGGFADEESEQEQSFM